VIDGEYIYNLPNSPDRWPDVGNGADCDPDNTPPTYKVRTNKVFIATQPSVSGHTVERYASDLKNGVDMPPLAAIKCKGGVIVWNGHHRLSAHRLAGRKTIPVRYWAEIETTVEELKRKRED
jgi:hypothetical protein